VDVPTGSGIGFEVDVDYIDAMTQTKESIQPSIGLLK